MARRSKQSILKRQRERQKAEKAALKRQKRAERRRRDAVEQQPEGTGPADPDSFAHSEEGTAEVRGDGV
jgi:hypothetical protein